MHRPTASSRRTLGHALPALVLAMIAGLPAHGQDAVMKSKDVTESALIDALTIDAPTALTGGSRGFRPAAPATNAGTQAPQAAAAAPARPAGPGKANLLIVFGTNSSVLSAESAAALDIVARALQSDALAAFSFVVEGHADARGDLDTNLRLSQQRAESVMNYLVSKHGVLPERLSATGKGSAEPMNRERVDAPENRRVTIVTKRG